MNSEPRVAFIVDALPSIGGGEKTLFAALEAYPRADVFSLVYNRGAFTDTPLVQHKLTTSFLDSIPLAHSHHRVLLPLMPAAIERFDLRGYDIAVSFSYAVAHGVRVPAGTRHISYTYTPMRYAWSDINLNGTRSRKNPAVNLMMENFRKWDRSAIGRVQEVSAISNYIAERIHASYQREARVIYPPVEVERFRPREMRGETYITLSRLVAHKRVDLIVEAFSKLGLPLLVIGTGPELPKLQRMAASNIHFSGYLPEQKVAEFLGQARGFVCAAEEDFGIAVVEAQAAGCPVLAYGQGGALETVEDGVTGLFFAEQTSASLIECVLRFEKSRQEFQAEAIARHAQRFNKSRFLEEFRAFVEKTG